jgi:NAD(P)-dependent dehydrogenase (short-subunit alcohol dehydrogenase family)
MNPRSALVIGGAGIIGSAIAERLAADGYQVSTADLSNADHAIDVSSEEQVRSLFASLPELHCLVNAFGVTSRGPFQSIGAAEWDRVQAVNLRGVFLTCRAALEPMKAAGWGRIVNIGSVVAKNGGNPRPWIDRSESRSAANAAYAAAKAGVHALTLCLAKEVAADGITVNAVAPGPIAGPMTTGFPEALVRQIPVGRLGTSDEVAAAVAWLCSKDAAFVTGEIVDVNGGLWLD